MNNALIKGFGITALAAAVAACGGSGSSDSDSTGTMSLGLTDAPVTDLTEVNLNITSVEVKPAEGKSVTVQVETEDGETSLDINLLDFQGGKVVQLFERQEFPAGEYEWIRLHLGDNPYVKEDNATPDTEVDLFVPSGFQTGLKLQGGFIIPSGGSADFTIDFDVRKSIVNAGERGTGDSKYILKPAHRLIDNTEAGSIIGDVDYVSINQNDALVACYYEGSVYVYSGDIPAEELTDLNSDNLDSEEGPLLSVPVEDEDLDGIHSFKAAFLPTGEYTIAYSCQNDDNESKETLEFHGRQTVTVVADVETEAKTIPLAQ
ncbi:hypothetical protein DIT71_16805 [Marinobacter vulgaris]|uniref:DUF4382 domain-containing protein n=1 Tax=Marinobacter vulgaris TaxID=1928331 RepID=A0A2V3ZJ98_9GAMM|nr:DUF4382 domain-containing protein [Marinobacter vulgaris]PXX88992.1 hypothetical protein DIT71_16805 [Marinobacter vulgaris]TSJ67018.1 DUF4382 domain-containing protein [Marinobacter vulgaris]